MTDFCRVKEISGSLNCIKRDFSIINCNTGVLFYPLGPSGIVTDDYETLHMFTVDRDGHFIFSSGLEFPQYMFRGQTDFYANCVPSIGRFKSDVELYKNLCYRVLFEENILKHPKVAYVNNQFAEKFLLNLPALSQHYGYPTDLMDLTSNFDVASFFASNSSRTGQGFFEPITEGVGYLYIFELPPILKEIDTAYGSHFQYVGWQIFDRPEQQRAFAMKLSPNEDLNNLMKPKIISFKQKGYVSRRLSKMFNKGNSLIKKDEDLENLKNSILEKKEFTRIQLHKAYNLGAPWFKNKYSENELIESCGFKTCANVKDILYFRNYTTSELDTWFREISEKIRFRPCLKI